MPELVAQARSERVGILFVSTPGRLATSAELPWFRALRSATAAAGIGVQALGAEVGWLDDHDAAAAWCWQSLDTGLFDGVHLDVEPWLHPAWGRRREDLLDAWVALLSRLSSGTALPVEADVAFWLHEHTVHGRPTDEAAMVAVDAVTVMSYRRRTTGPDSLTRVAAPVLAAAAELGRPVRLAVETRDLGPGAANARQTFFGTGRGSLDRALDELDAVLAGHPTYAGIAVHDHAGWSAMPGRAAARPRT